MNKSSSLLYPLLSGILLSLTLPHVGFWPIVWVALVPYLLFAASAQVSVKKNITGSLFFGVPYAIATTYPLMDISGWWWVSSGDLSEGKLLFGGMVVLVALWGALFFIPVGLLARKAMGWPLAPVILAIGWTIIEWLRTGFALFGYSWGVLGYTLIDTVFVKQVAQIFGVYGLSFLIVGVNGALATLLYSYGGPKSIRQFFLYSLGLIRRGGTPMAGVFAVSAFFVGAVVYGAANTFVGCEYKEPLRVAVIGSTLSTEESVGGGAYRMYRKEMLSALTQKADIIALPENAFPFFEIDEETGSLRTYSIVPLANKEELYADLISITRNHPRTTFAVGLHTHKKGKRHNSVVFIQNGELIAYYHKRKLVPFVEYVPISLAPSPVVVFEPGEARQYVNIGGIQTAVLACSEVGDSHIDTVGAELIIASSNDSVFEGSAIPRIHHAMARMRALESGAYLLRPSKGGVSSVIAPDGRVMAHGEGETLVTQIQICK